MMKANYDRHDPAAPTPDSLAAHLQDHGLDLPAVRLSPRGDYLGTGVLPMRSGPTISPEATLHEIAHMIDFDQEGTLARRLGWVGWGMDVPVVTIAGKECPEALTSQASRREARVFGIQWRLMQALAIEPEGPFRAWVTDKADVLATWMPDSCYPAPPVHRWMDRIRDREAFRNGVRRQLCRGLRGLLPSSMTAEALGHNQPEP